MVDSLAQAGASKLDGLAWEETQAEIQNRWLEPCEVSYLRLVDELTATILVMLRKCGDSALPNLVGRTFDLKSAYKQFGVDVEHQKTLRIAQRHPDGGVKFFAVQSLPFGATACVSSSCA